MVPEPGGGPHWSQSSDRLPHQRSVRPTAPRSIAQPSTTQRDIRVLYPDGSRAADASYVEALAMIHAHVAHELGGDKRRSRRRLRTIQLEDGPSRPRAGTRYSHCHAVSEEYAITRPDGEREVRRRDPLDANPAGVWTLKRLDASLRPLFTVVLDGCVSSVL